MGWRRLSLILGAVTALLGAAAQSAVAAQAAPGWRLYSDTLPTNLTLGVSEVQLVAAGTENPFVLVFEGAETPSLGPAATAGEVQSALDALGTIGTGNVIVASAGSPGNYTVTFTGALGKVRVPQIESPTAEVSVTAQGAASGTIAVYPFNVGASRSAGPIVITDKLPPGLRAKAAGTLLEAPQGENLGVVPQLEPSGWQCSGNGTSGEQHINGATILSCEIPQNGVPSMQGFVGIAGGGGLPTLKPLEALANPQPILGIEVEAEHERSGLLNHVAISGGGGAAASTTNSVTVSSGLPSQGITKTAGWQTTKSGLQDSQAGSHPYESTYIFDAATALNENNTGYVVGSEIRNLEVQLPAGFIGDLHELPRCTRQQLLEAECPEGSIVGVLSTTSFLPLAALQTPIFNMAPEPGQPAELGLKFESISSYVRFTVRSGSDYGIVAHADNLPRRAIYQAMLTLWGVPQDSSHDIWRSLAGAGCTQEELERPRLGVELNYCTPLQGRILAPTLTLPTSCKGPLETTFRVRGGWQEPLELSESTFLSDDANEDPQGLTGCEAVPAEVQTSARAQSARTDTSSGLEVSVRPNLGGLDAAEGIADSTLKGATVALPRGIVVNPGQAAGLQSCPEGRPDPSVGKYGDAITTPEEVARNEEDADPAYCPAAAKLGTVTVSSPLLEADAEHELTGDVYLLPSQPPQLSLLIAVSGDGVAVKLKGMVHLDETTGQLVASFTETPPLPFSDLTVVFAGGAKAAIDTPTKCGTYAVNSEFEPWSTPFAGNALSTANMVFAEGASGGGCVSNLPLEPEFSGGAENTQAGGYTPLTVHIARHDGQQRLKTVATTTPPGLTAMISSVEPCQEPAAAAGTCPSSSRIGHVVVEAGAGAVPLQLPQPGGPEAPVYLTGPYDGAPFGLSVVAPVVAGPFNLGPLVTRARILVNPETAQVSVVTDPLPQIFKGVPTDIRAIDVKIDKSHFVLNPTNCEQSELTASVEGTGAPYESEVGKTVALSSPFAVGACRALTFAPTVVASTNAHASRRLGQRLTIHLSYPIDAVGKQAWLKEAKFVIPRQLPAEQRTLGFACPEATFASHRADCSPHSIIGSAVVHTPVLPVPLTGPVYFVSHGGAKFPDVVMTLTGDNVNVTLRGETNISHGITSARFRRLPEVPFSSVDVTLPTGEYSEFGGYVSAANPYNFCGQKLSIPVTLAAANGLTRELNVEPSITGCPTAATIRSVAVTGHRVKITVFIPASGKLTLSGAALARTKKHAAAGTELVTLEASLRKVIAKGKSTIAKLVYQRSGKKPQRLTVRLHA